MRSRDAQRPQGRPGFTLIELLVVIFLISFLAALTMVIGPALIVSEPASRGAQQLQSNLFVAKQQALRDGNPYGIRLLKDSQGFYTSFQFIQQPNDFTGGTIMVDPTGKIVSFNGVDPTGGLPSAALYPVQIGDFLQVPSGGTPHLITQVNPGTPPTATLNTATANAGQTTPDYRIFRAPRPVPGEDTIFLPDNVIIDLQLSRITWNPRTGNYDILFSPGGSVIGSASFNGQIILWVRDTTQPVATTTQQSLIVVFTRTGLIASYPVNTNPNLGGGSPYYYVLQPRAAGGL